MTEPRSEGQEQQEQDVREAERQLAEGRAVSGAGAPGAEASAEVAAGLAAEEPRGGGGGAPGVGGAGAAPEKLLRAKEVVEGIFERLGADVEVDVRDSAEAISCSVTVRRGGRVLEVGPRGQVLEAVQYLVNRIVNRDADARKFISVELGHFRERAVDPAMEEMARRLGVAAKRIGKTLTVVPIQSRDRRVVHQVLSEVEGVRTRSEGEGILRRLLVEVVPAGDEPAEGKEPSDAGEA